jgi:hypothetical protein
VGKSGGISDSVKQSELGIAQQSVDIAKQQQANSQQEFNTAFPGFQQAENYYSKLATGDPAAISRAIAPAAQQIDAQSTATAQRIDQDSPRGGAKNLALEENQINKGAQIGQLASQGYLSSFQNLAGLAGQGVGESTSSAGTALSGLSNAGNQYSNVAQQQAEGKATQLGFISSLAGSGAELAGMCWIAVALWGENDLRTIIVRYYFNCILTEHWFGKHICAVYRKYGTYIARKVEASERWHKYFEKLFTRIYLRAERVIPQQELKGLYSSYFELRGRKVTHA